MTYAISDSDLPDIPDEEFEKIRSCMNPGIQEQLNIEWGSWNGRRKEDYVAAYCNRDPDFKDEVLKTNFPDIWELIYGDSYHSY